MLTRRENRPRSPLAPIFEAASSALLASRASSFQICDSARPWRIHQTMAATTNKCRKMSRDPSSPSGASPAARANPISGPTDQASWAVPTCRARSMAGACSAM